MNLGRLAPQAGLEPATLRLTATSFKSTWDHPRQRAPFLLGNSSAGGNPGRPESTPDCPQFVPATRSGLRPESRRISTERSTPSLTIGRSATTRGLSRAFRRSRYTRAPWLDHDERADHAICKLLNNGDNGVTESTSSI